MASYAELYGLNQSDSVLRQRVTVAVVVAANAIRTEAGATPNHANRLLWAADALKNPFLWAERMLWSALAVNKDASVQTIQGVTDANLQTAINGVVDFYATG